MFTCGPSLFGGGPRDPYFSKVVALLHFDGTNGSTSFPDSSRHHYTLTSVNGTALSTSSPKFGTAAASFNGTNNGISSNIPLGIGTQDFTIEGWAKPTAVTAIQRLINAQTNTSTTGVVILRINASAKLEAVIRDVSGGAATTYTTTGSISSGSYSHLALCRASNVIYLSINGTVQNLGSNTNNIIDNTNNTFYAFGAYLAGSTEYFGGMLDECRITEGVARYTSNFTTPTLPFPNQ